MNKTANFAHLTWADMAHAGWQVRITARSGENATASFTTPQGTVEVREVPVSRLGSNLRAQMDRIAPQRRPAPQLRIRIR